MRGRKPVPTAIRRANGNPGKRAFNLAEPTPPSGIPQCPAHLSDAAREEWDRLAVPLHQMGVLSIADRAAMAAYCQAWARWVEAEERLAETPPMLKTPSGYVQQSPWLSVANKQLEIMGRFMSELGLTPVSRSRVEALRHQSHVPVTRIEHIMVRAAGGGTVREKTEGACVIDAIATDVPARPSSD